MIFLFDVLCFPLFDGPIGEFRKSAPDATQHAVVLAAVKDAAREWPEGRAILDGRCARRHLERAGRDMG